MRQTTPQPRNQRPYPGVEWTFLPSSRRLWSGEPSAFTITVVHSGVSVWRIGGVERQTLAGGVRLKRPGDHFRTVSVEEASAMTVLSLDSSVLARLGPREAAAVFGAAQIDKDDEIARAVSALGDNPDDAEALVALLSRLTGREGGESTAPGRSGRRADIARARTFIDRHATEALRLEELAAVVDLHPVTLVRLFREEYGLPPRAYLIERRVEIAQAMLAAGAATIDAAMMVGFYDQSHLHRHFKRRTGFTPAAFAQEEARLRGDE